MNLLDSLLWEIGTLLAGAILTALVLAVGHWFEWPRKLTRIEAYIYGVLSLLAGFALWRGLNRDWCSPLGLLLICGVGGLTVVAAYGWDSLMARSRQARRAAAIDDELQDDGL